MNTRQFRKNGVAAAKIGFKNAGLVAAAGLLFLLSACSKVPASAGVPINGYAEIYHAERDLSTSDIGTKQTLLGDVIADAVRASAKTDVAFVQAAEFSDKTVTLSRMGFGLPDILKTLEYRGNTIGIVKVTGEQMRGALENSLYQYPERSSAFLQTSGLMASFNPSAHAGKRFTSIKVNGAPLDNSKIYRIAMPLSLANGAIGFFKFWKKSDIEKDTGISLEVALTNYLNEHKAIVKGEDRVVASSK